MDRCTGRRDITEIPLKTALNTIQSIKSLCNAANHTYGLILSKDRMNHEAILFFEMET